LKIFINKRILIISPEGWQHNFLSKHHYAIALASAGNTVFFLNPPSSINRCHETFNSNLKIIDYRFIVRGLNKIPQVLKNLFQKGIIRKIENLAKGKFDIVWSFDPYRFQNLNLFNCDGKIYYAADVHQGKLLERSIADTAQLVISPSYQVLEGIICKTTKAHIFHAVAGYFFNRYETKILPGKNKIKVGYVGNLQSKYLDYELLKKTIQRNAHCDFIFIGDSENIINTYTHVSNVYFLGSIANDKLPALLQSCDMLLLCYNTEKFWKEASNSHKVMEYLSSGKVVLSTRLAAYMNMKDLLIMPKQNLHLPELLEGVSKEIDVYNNEANSLRRIAFAREHTYERNLEIIDSLLAGGMH
jgi:hypothetical protein